MTIFMLGGALRERKLRHSVSGKYGEPDGFTTSLRPIQGWRSLQIPLG
jgi:hypothetical protein